MSRSTTQVLISLTLLFTLSLTACGGGGTPTPLPSAAPGTPQATGLPPAATATAQPTPAPTAIPPKTLVVCLGQEPTSLYMYGSSSRATWSVLEAIYDGPVDTRQYSPQPVILHKLPSLADGSAVYTPVEVASGADVVDVDGNLVDLAAGTRVLPSGCTSPACARTWDGKSPLQMDQLTLTYQFWPGITWSDGTPLTAADSLYSFKIASHPDTPASKHMVDRTAAYQAKDDLTVEWSGVPGFSPQSYASLLWNPLPQHLLSKFTPAELLKAAEATVTPPGWGAYRVEEWKKGEFIRLSKNPNYFRASEGLPYFDALLFRFLGEQGDNNLQALLEGKCDVLDESVLLFDQLQTLLEQQSAGKLRLHIAQGPEWEQLSFGIKPASYDDGYIPGTERADLFSDVRMRTAVAYCIDREAVNRQLLNSRSTVPVTSLPPGHPLQNTDLAALPYDVGQANQLLSELGWKDTDGNPATPRAAVGVANVPNGTPLSLDYFTTEASLRVQTAELIAKNLSDCGIQVKVHTLNPGQLYAPGPQGVLFGRQFDLAQFSWEAGSLSACSLYETRAIPAAKNDWLGGNITGFSDAAFDLACQQARASRPEPVETYAKAFEQVQRLFAQQLPVLPLYYRLKLAASRPEVCGLKMDASARSVLWNIEEISAGLGCP